MHLNVLVYVKHDAVKYRLWCLLYMNFEDGYSLLILYVSYSRIHSMGIFFGCLIDCLID